MFLCTRRRSNEVPVVPTKFKLATNDFDTNVKRDTSTNNDTSYQNICVLKQHFGHNHDIVAQFYLSVSLFSMEITQCYPAYAYTPFNTFL